MDTFDGTFFNELATLDEYVFTSVNPRNSFGLCVSELHAICKISDEFVKLTHDFVVTLAMRS